MPRERPGSVSSIGFPPSPLASLTLEVAGAGAKRWMVLHCRGFLTRVHTGVHTGVQRRGFSRGSGRGFTGCDTVRAERAGWLGATSELRDGDSLKTASERVPSSPARLRLRRTAHPVAQPIGRGRSDQPSRRRGREHAPRRGRFSAQRSGSSRRGFTRRFTTGFRTVVHDDGSAESSRRGSPLRHGPSRASRLARGDL